MTLLVLSLAACASDGSTGFAELDGIGVLGVNPGGEAYV
jgi:hypothetical protein